MEVFTDDCAADDHFLELRIAADRAAGEIGHHAAGRDRVGSDAARAVLDRDVAGEYLDRTFAGAIQAVARHLVAIEGDRDEDDAAMVVHDPQQFLRKKQDALEVDVAEPVELVLGDVVDRNGFADAGIVDQEVDPLGIEGIAKRGLYPCDETVELRTDRDVEL